MRMPEYEETYVGVVAGIRRHRNRPGPNDDHGAEVRAHGVEVRMFFVEGDPDNGRWFPLADLRGPPQRVAPRVSETLRAWDGAAYNECQVISKGRAHIVDDYVRMWYKVRWAGGDSRDVVGGKRRRRHVAEVELNCEALDVDTAECRGWTRNGAGGACHR